MTCAAVGGATLLATADAATKAGAVQLRGRTAQGRLIRLEARAGSIQLIRFIVRLRCRDGAILTDEESGFLPSRVRAGGGIHDAQVGSTDEVLLRGRLRGRRLRGAIRVRDRLEGSRCDSHWVRFTATG